MVRFSKLGDLLSRKSAQNSVETNPGTEGNSGLLPRTAVTSGVSTSSPRPDTTAAAVASQDGRESAETRSIASGDVSPAAPVSPEAQLASLRVDEQSLLEPSRADAPDDQCSECAEPWARAFQIVQEREPKLMGDYKVHLASLQDDLAVTDLSAPRSVQALVDSLQKEREQKQWRVSLFNSDIKIREQTEKLSKFLLWSDSIVKSVVSAQPYAALAWTGVSLLLPLVTSGTTQNEAMLKGFTFISDLQIYWRISENMCLQENHSHEYNSLLEKLAKMYSIIIEYQARAICHLSKSQISRAWQNVTDAKYWTGVVERIQAADKACRDIIGAAREQEIRKNRDEQLREMYESRTILDDIRQILKASEQETRQPHMDEQQRQLLQCLASDYDSYKDFNPKKVQGTCEWLFNDERFRQWRDRDASSLLWVSAGPGCGKSVLSRALIDEDRLSINITTAKVCHFFFKDGYEGRMKSTDALCAILHQVISGDGTGALLKIAIEPYRSHGNTIKSNFSMLWRTLIQCAESAGSGEIVCLLDALDECEKTSRQQLIDNLKEFYDCDGYRKLPVKLKFIITSRPYDDLEMHFEAFATTAYLRFDGDEKSSEIGREIDLVIDDQVKKIAAKFSEHDRRAIANHLKGMENRTYLWLYLIFDTIKEKFSRYRKRSSIEALLSSIPNRVYEAYEKILSRNQDEADTEALLGIMLAAAQPLTLDEANVALTMARADPVGSQEELNRELWPREDFQSTVRNLCGLFVTVHDARLSFIHQTAREFLLHGTAEGAWKGRFRLAGAHALTSRCCINYMLLTLDCPPIEQSIKRDADGAWYCVDVFGPRPFLYYALSHWTTHFASQDASAAGTSTQRAQQLCGLLWTHRGFSIMSRKCESSGLMRFHSDIEVASFLGVTPVVEYILQERKYRRGGDERDSDVDYALTFASISGYHDVMRALLATGADVNAAPRPDSTVASPLAEAAWRGRQDTVQLLLDAGADANYGGASRWSPLEYVAARRCHNAANVIKMLIKAGAFVTAQALMGVAYGPLSSSGSSDLLRMLLAEVSVEMDHEALVEAAGRIGGVVDFVRMLIEAGVVGTDAPGWGFGDMLWGVADSYSARALLLLAEEWSKARVESWSNSCAMAFELAYEWRTEPWYMNVWDEATRRRYEKAMKLLENIATST